MGKVAPVAVLGAGSWGTALAIVLARNGSQVRLWGLPENELAEVGRDRENKRYLPGYPIPDNVQIEPDLDAALANTDTALVVVPSHAFGETMEKLAGKIPRLAWATKGLEPGSGRLLQELAVERLGDTMPLAAISGPSFAAEVAAGLPTAVAVASTAPGFADDLARRLHGQNFRAYTSTDMIGVQIGGAIKNVIAIATGLADGLGMGANARAALVTRGLAEVSRLVRAMGGRSETMMGLAGLGDLVLTCTNDQSRNRRLGLALAAGKPVKTAMEEIGQVVEGYYAARDVHFLAQREQVEMPVAEQTYQILYHGLSPHVAARTLMDRDLKAEM